MLLMYPGKQGGLGKLLFDLPISLSFIATQPINLSPLVGFTTWSRHDLIHPLPLKVVIARVEQSYLLRQHLT